MITVAPVRLQTAGVRAESRADRDIYSPPGRVSPHKLALLPLLSPGATAHNGAYVVSRAIIGQTSNSILNLYPE